MHPQANRKTLAQWLAFQEQSHTSVIDLGLTRVRWVADRLQLLQPSATTIIVAGTNGKGSSTAMLSHIYTLAGYRTGWYSSPHLLNYNERIRINDVPVSDALLIDAFEAIAAVLELTTLSYFEWGTLAALWLFQQQACDVQILEVGLGGRLDATNVIDADAALITAIDLDHADWLGSTREQVAREKAGVLRSNQLAVCSDINPPHTLVEIAGSLSCSIWYAGKDFVWHQSGEAQWLWQQGDKQLRLPALGLQGDFQYQNAAGVVAVVEGLHSRLPVEQSVLAQGLAGARLLGRMDCREKAGIRWCLDVAHNPHSIQALADYWHQQHIKPILLFSALADKDIKAMVTVLSPYVVEWHVAPLHHSRGASVAQLREALASIDMPVYWYADIPAACDTIASQALLRPVWVCGSFVTVEQVLRWLV
jgi:dihydrofolate synthase/folylpolyglutamate synthase